MIELIKKTWSVWVVGAILVGLIGFVSLYGMTYATDYTPSYSASQEKGMSPCPICKKSTKDSQLAWQGMCEKCYKDYKYTQELYDAI